ncbi:reverse transcriptase domain-containing protein [Favolaschia claudopus]|uniref:Reverse transcriptase domain-containing protein n=1 Tax=Favolaschia claudopus TaxID=2862362 RepID=A0AAW0AF27_9AGAR
MQVSTLVKTQFLKHRLERDDAGKLVTLGLRHYLRLVNPSHRVAYTRFLVSDHKLAIEELRHANRSWRYVERELRLCRFCHAGVEDECHALLICPGHPSLSRLRADFLRDVFMSQPDLRRLTSAPAYDFLLALVANHNLTARVAKLVYDVLELYKGKELWVPPSHFLRADSQ